MKKLIIVSNRLPITVTKSKKDAPLEFKNSIGGLATGLSSFYRAYNAMWIGWPGIASDKLKEKEKEKIINKLSEDNCYPVFLTQREIDNYYHGFCNNVIWPLFHYFPTYMVNRNIFWQTYIEVNQKFADIVKQFVGKDDAVWVHDYQLMLTPKFLRSQISNINLGFFLHIPFPSYEIFRMLPYRKQILEGLIGADLVGFHTYDYVRHFLNSIRHILGLESNLGHIYTHSNITKADIFPIGIHFERFRISNSEIENELNDIKGQIHNNKVILSVDRLDYSKGIIQKLQAFDRFLDKNPKFAKRVMMIIVVVPSRTNIEHYRLLKKQIDELIGNINGRRSTFKWSPIYYLYRPLTFERLLALYRISDIALITPLRDGMNLVSKEFLASKLDGKGVLILSEAAGSAKELGEAIIVNPNDIDEIAKAIEVAINMPEQEQIERNRVMIDRLKRYNIIKWAKDFVDTLKEVKSLEKRFFDRIITENVEKKIIEDFTNAEKRSLILDYDGTLVEFSKSPEAAKPDIELLGILKNLASDKKNDVVIASGRDRKTLEKWFGNLDISLIAEHGAWIKEKGDKWKTIEPLSSDWKKMILPILELYVDRTPGSFIEEKEFSLVWHYRKADNKLAAIRSIELRDALMNFVKDLKLEIMDGNKVLEIKKVNIDKGKAAIKLLGNLSECFVLAIGDDITDESIFGILPKNAYSIKVGLGFSKAKYNILSVKNVRRLLKKLAGEGAKDGQ